MDVARRKTLARRNKERIIEITSIKKTQPASPLHIRETKLADHQPPPVVSLPGVLGGVILRIGAVGGLGNLMPNWSR